MRKNLIPISIILIVLSFIIGHVTNCDCGKGKEVTEVNYPIWHDSEKFENGELLYPDYTHDDTLIITNGEALNRIFADTANPLTMPTTDWEIYTTLHLYCKPINDKQP